MTNITTTKINSKIWQFNEKNKWGPYVDAYLILGTASALVVDCLQTEPDLYEEVREITDLPLTLVITHGHGDHAGESLRGFREAGCPIYMSLCDFPTLQESGIKGMEESWFTDLPDGMVFDLGTYCLQVLALPGHTKGSVILWDKEKRIMFSGDTIGSGGFWMQIPSALPILEFSKGLARLTEAVKDIKNLRIFPGHRNQSPVQLREQYIADIDAITAGILDGTMEGKPQEMYQYGTVGSYCYNHRAILHPPFPNHEEKMKKKFRNMVYRNLNQQQLPCMLFSPMPWKKELFPVVVYLHRENERGNDPRKVLNTPGSVSFTIPFWQNHHNCYTFAPQCPEGDTWTNPALLDLVVQAIQKLVATRPADPDRIYITGASLGAMGVWKALTLYPDVFAAAMPICGGVSREDLEKVPLMPLWAFHAADDDVIPCEGEFPEPVTGETLLGTCTAMEYLRSKMPTADHHFIRYAPGELSQKFRIPSPHAAWIPGLRHTPAKMWLFNQKRGGTDVETPDCG
ncbi:MAG: MBL fold metallo-hydrolase [Oscillospiraceae bacterium]